MQAKQVRTAPTKAETNRRAMFFGINDLTPFTRLSSIEFPTSFPYDFMHAVFQNVVPTLLDLWTHTGRMDRFGSGREDYILSSDAWSGIGAACAKSGKTIPSLFGCRVPNLATDRHLSTAESTTLFATLLGPSLLRGEFKQSAYYDHFIELVRLINMCLDLEIKRKDIDKIREGFAGWVQGYEKHRPTRLGACTLPLHSLLHIADDMTAMGPVWCYWAYPMERFCGSLARSQKSRRFPFSSLDRRVLEVAQLSQIKAMYRLGDELSLDERRHNVDTGVRYRNYPACAFVRPRAQRLLPLSIQRPLAQYLSPIVHVDAKAILRRLRTHPLVNWGRMQAIVEDGPADLYRANEMVPTTETMERDASYVKYYTYVDRCDVRKPRQLEQQTEGYGQIQRFVIVDANFLQDITDQAAPILDPLAVAVIQPIPAFSLLKDANLVTYTLPGNKLANPEIVAADDIVCLVGRVQARDDTWYIADRHTIVGRLDLVEAMNDPD
ncbi:hypothetical protein FRC07_001330 [Ceratobasidium sp. 392]|nr:hypothetical protein FRC07_001330 [Ceratobasidium sp. 392]